MNKLFFFIVILSKLNINSATWEVPFESEPHLSKYVKDDRYFYFPGDGNGKIYLIDSYPMVTYSGTAVYNPVNSYWLYTRKNMDKSQELIIHDTDSVSKSNFDPSKNTVFIVHGWKGNCNNTISTLLTSVFLGDGDVNVIVVDYSGDAGLIYVMAILAAARVGTSFGQFLEFMNTLGMLYENTHLVGFSLGGHVVGIAGRYINGMVQRITALDPAGPLWYDNEDRLRKTDGKYVEVIHTNMMLFGYDGKLGDADFYPNGGIIMPECDGNTCSHSVSYYYMAQTIKYNDLIARECNNLNEVNVDLCNGNDYPMGNSDLTKNRTGMFRVDTTSNKAMEEFH